eukprot:COSAG06_NODE_1231_length_10153_cov_60.823623_9_plen_65_part_00
MLSALSLRGFQDTANRDLLAYMTMCRMHAEHKRALKALKAKLAEETSSSSSEENADEEEEKEEE